MEGKRVDTIAAVATAPGIGGIGIIRMSGPEALSVAGRVFRGNKRAISEAPSHSLTLGWVVDPLEDKLVDQVLAAVMRSPATYTGEDVVEFQCHGGAAVLRAVLGVLLKLGVRAAEPGEFTKRAFLNGRIDLVQAEAVLDVVKARCGEALGIALNQVEGRLSRTVTGLRDRLLSALAHVSASMDFCDDVEGPSQSEVVVTLKAVLDEVERLSETFLAGRVLRGGLRVAILGKPNVGKSSLLNALVGRDRAIVDESPGTTRDVIEADVNIRGVPIVVMDTAGIREAVEAVEREGIERSGQALRGAEIALVVLDDSRGVDAEDIEVLRMSEGYRRIVVVNKMDLGMRLIECREAVGLAPEEAMVWVSAATGENLGELEAIIGSLAYPSDVSGEVVVSNARHARALQGTAECLRRALMALDEGAPLDLVGLDLEEAVRVLGEITGEKVSEDLLDRIFRDFCVGK